MTIWVIISKIHIGLISWVFIRQELFNRNIICLKLFKYVEDYKYQHYTNYTNIIRIENTIKSNINAYTNQ